MKMDYCVVLLDYSDYPRQALNPPIFYKHLFFSKKCWIFFLKSFIMVY